MTQDEQRIAIAEAVGWNCDNCDNPPSVCRGCIWTDDDRMMPRYLDDRNAMAWALATIPKYHWAMFIHILGLDVLKLCPLVGDIWLAQELDCWLMINATTPQLAEAFLRTIGKWKD